VRAYDQSKPLIFIHVPKSAGTSVRDVVQGWFPGRFHQNYFNEIQGTMPVQLPPEILSDSKNPPVIYGHFNKLRGFGIQDYYPNADQFVTILRDPFELAVSEYFFVRKSGQKWKDKSRVPTDSLQKHIRATNSAMLNHFPREMTQSNYVSILEEYFVEIGITEMLPQSLSRISAKLGTVFNPADLEWTNATERDQPVPQSLRDDFAEANPLEFAVYEYAKSRFNDAQ